MSQQFGAPQQQTGATSQNRVLQEQGLDRGSVVNREKDEYGGIKIGSAFFGWLTATGTAVLLIAVIGALGAAVGYATNTNVDQVATTAATSPETVGWGSAIALLAVLFVAYYCGGYVAGRMARFNGMKQGIATWLWGVVITIALAVVTAVAGAEYNLLGQLNLPRLPIDEGTLTTAGIVALLAIAVASLGGAILGGLAGMRFHRNVDEAGLRV